MGLVFKWGRKRSKKNHMTSGLETHLELGVHSPINLTFLVNSCGNFKYEFALVHPVHHRIFSSCSSISLFLDSPSRLPQRSDIRNKELYIDLAFDAHSLTTNLTYA